ncbi:SDR family NAD(P)-dependent oxidoreductase [Paenibacillus yonginensis]|uniref:SDR family NAD(P)-dependent oxidoreductase n=1 Tax=Paenibacillus yonginensis TaxID=1462996 RepID=UPI000AB81645|nr:SDR family NAD(P)-dependent oxidoreductase [Paenibacillus yonginensis]
MVKSEQIERGHSFKGKRVVVLGGTSGIGFAAAEAAAWEGASLVIVSSQKEKADRAVSRLSEGSQGYAVDLTNEEQVRQFFSEIGEFDHLVFTPATH